VYASPIERTTQTAQAVADHHGLVVLPLEGVLEADYGDWTGQKLADLAKTDLWKVVQRTPSRASFPSGESLAAMQTRMITALEAVVASHPGQLVVVVSHADPIKAAIAHYTGVHLDLFQRIVVSPASVTAFAFSEHGVAMLKCNDTGVLDELKPPPPSPDAGKGRKRKPAKTDSDGAASGRRRGRRVRG
jgi:broad specificity phosphatase PhoE